MNIFHKPKRATAIVFCVLTLVCIISNVLFFLIYKNQIPKNDLMLELIHIGLPLCYLSIFIFVVSYILLCVEKICTHLSGEEKRRKTLGVLLVLYLLAGLSSVYLISTPIIGDEKVAYSIFLSKLCYFQCVPTTTGFSTICEFWGTMPVFFCVALSLILFVGVGRLAKKRKIIAEEADKKRVQQEINERLGFAYQTCEFYKQVKLTYQELNKDDGSWGEFEAYRALVSGGVSDAKYLFNREVPKEDGLSTELDLVVIHKKGIVVIENKHYTTRIFGDATDKDLTIIDKVGNKKSIYNPIVQNEKHVAALKNYLKSKKLFIDEIVTPIHSVVVFTAEVGDRTDDIISGIDIEKTKTHICTSQNVANVVMKLLNSTNETELNVGGVYDVLETLPVRRKNIY